MIESTPAGRASGRSAPQVVLALVLLVLIVPVAIAVFMAAYAVAEFAQGSHAPVGAPSLLVSVGQLLAVACSAVCGVRFARSRSPRSRWAWTAAVLALLVLAAWPVLVGGIGLVEREACEVRPAPFWCE